MTITETQVRQVLQIAETTIPGLSAVPGMSEATALVASLLTRLINGETLDAIAAEPLKMAPTIDIEKLKADLAAAAGGAP